MTRVTRPSRNVTKGRGWVGLWHEGEPGWMMPEFIHESSSGSPSEGFNEYAGANDRAYFCEVTVRILKDKRGRYLTRKRRQKTD